jgi:hypothetical protein
VYVKMRVLPNSRRRRPRLLHASQSETDIKKTIDIRFDGSMIFDDVVDEPFSHTGPSFRYLSTGQCRTVPLESRHHLCAARAVQIGCSTENTNRPPSTRVFKNSFQCALVIGDVV